MRRRAVAAVRHLRIGRKADGDSPVVLLYHRLGRLSSDPQLLCVTPDHFDEHLQLIAERHQPVALADLVAALRTGRAPRRAVAVTFDDGYADNLHLAKPALERSGVPATVFAASGHVRSGRPFWWDELERLLLRPGRLPPVLSLQIGAETTTWELGDEAAFTPTRAAERVTWTVLEERDPGVRQRIYRLICDRLRPLDVAERERALDDLRAVAEPDETGDEPAARPLTSEELSSLSAGTLVEVGAHTITHATLSRLGADRQRQEVEGSKRQLEEVLGRPVRAFSYPYGTATDYDASTVALVRQAGFHYACANVPARVGRRVDAFRIPRVLVRDWSGDELARCLMLLSG